MDKKKELLHDLQKTGALIEGHFVLSSGLHSERYVQCARLLQFPELAEKYARYIASSFVEKPVDAVLGPAIGGIVFGYELAKQLNVRAIFTERGADGAMLLRRGFEINPGEKIIISEDVITTGKSTLEVIEIIKENDAVLEGVACMIDRSRGAFNPGAVMESIISIDIDAYSPSACPLCEKGVPQQKPGSRK